MEATTLASVLTDLGSVFTSLIGYVGDVCETIVSNPILLIATAVGFAFTIVGFVKNLM